MGSVSIANSLAYAPNFAKGIIAAGKIDQLIEREPLVQDPKSVDPNKAWNVEGAVTCNETKFFYPSRPSSMVLQGLNLEITPGQSIALVGSSGCGKSTILQLLLRYYDPISGTVAIDLQNTNSLPMVNLRSQMGIVSQEPCLFDRTIAENIAYGDNTGKAMRADVIEAAKQANIHNFIVSLPLVSNI